MTNDTTATIFSASDITKVSEIEDQLATAILVDLTGRFKTGFDAAEEPGNFKDITVPRKAIVVAAQTATGATLTPKVRAHLVVRAKACGFKLDPLGGDKGNSFILSIGRKGGGRTKMTDAEKATAKEKREAAKAEKADATSPETDSK